MSPSLTPLADAEAGTPFVKALRWRVHSPEEALHMACTHRRRMTDCREGGRPGMELQARTHELMAAICEERAAELDRMADA